MSIDMWAIIIGVGTPIIAGLAAAWWHVESRQDKAICALRERNAKDHDKIREQLDDTKDTLTTQHHSLRDKIDLIWQHLLKEKRGG